VPRSRIALFLAVAVALVFGAAFPALLLPDSPLYLEPARSWARGDGLMEAPGRPLEGRLPAYPLLLGVILWTVGEHLRAIAVVQVLLHVAAMLLVRQMVRRVSASAADWCAALAIVYPPFLTATATVLQETMLSFLAALFAWRLWRAAEAPSGARAFAAGVALGATVLGKVVILPLAGPAALLLAFVPRRSVVRAAWFVAGVAVIVLPWGLRNRAVLGRFEVTNANGGHALLGGAVSNNITDWHAFPEYVAARDRWAAGERVSQPVLDRYLYKVAWARIGADPVRWVGLVVGRAVRFMLPSRHWMAAQGWTTPGRLPPLFVAGAILQGLAFLAAVLLLGEVFRGRSPLVWGIPPAIVLWHLAAYAVFYVSPRYNVTVGPLIVASAALWWSGRYKS